MSIMKELKFDRDGYARSYAKRHRDTDIGVVQIFHLPTNAAPNEIRLLEINNLISETTPPEPIDFGVDTGSADAHTLYVLDVTPAQWEAIQKNAMPLPHGWTLDGNQDLSMR